MPRITDRLGGRVRLGATALSVSVLATAQIWTGTTAGAHDVRQSERTFVPHTSSQVAFHDQMRKLWEDHITWTRLAIVAAVDDLPDTGLTVDLLLRNQDDIGAAIAPFYGEAAGQQLTVLLREHITVAVELILAAKSGDSAAFEDAEARWYANGDAIADFLGAANPRFWPRDVMREAMRTHLDQTLAEAAHRIAGDHAAEIADYEEVHAHILVMADLLSSGVMQQFPSRFHGPNDRCRFDASFRSPAAPRPEPRGRRPPLGGTVALALRNHLGITSTLEVPRKTATPVPRTRLDSGTVVTDLGGRIIAADDAFCQIVGRSRADVVGA